MKQNFDASFEPDVNLDVLIESFVKGDKSASNKIATYLFSRQTVLAPKANPTFLSLLSQEDIDENYSTAIYSAIASYSLGKGHFISYFLLLYSRAVIKTGLKIIRNQAKYSVVSLDERDEDGLCLCDVVADASPSTNPVLCYEKEELDEKLEKIKKNQKKEIAANIIEKLNLGYTAEEVARSYNLPKKKVKNTLYAFKKGVKKTLAEDEEG